MTGFVTYRLDTGEIVGAGSCPEWAIEAQSGGPGCGVLPLEAPIDPDCFRVVNGELVPCYRKPGPLHQWDVAGGQWALSADVRFQMWQAERVGYLTDTDWLVTRHRDQVDARQVTTLTAEQYAELLAFRQALRDAKGELPAPPDWLQ